MYQIVLKQDFDVKQKYLEDSKRKFDLHKEEENKFQKMFIMQKEAEIARMLVNFL